MKSTRLASYVGQARWPGTLAKRTCDEQTPASDDAIRTGNNDKEENGAGDEIRTHDPHVGNVMLYH